MPDPEKPAGAKAGERIAKLLARAGVASRREVERMIAEGRIKLGDAVVATPATILASLKGITVDGQPVHAAEAPRLFAFHKPSGLITAESDPKGRPTIYTALRNALPKGTPRVMPVGRLDLNTEGLLLLTNDGELKRAMELPSSGIPRTYRARTYGSVTQQQLEALMDGIEIEGMRYGPINANMERKTGRNQWIELTLKEGKNREVRRVLEYLGLEVSRLLRVAYGPFILGDLPRGAAVEIRQVDVERFRKAIGVPERMAELPPMEEKVAARPARAAKPVRVEKAPAVAQRPVKARRRGPLRESLTDEAPRVGKAPARRGRPAKPGAPRPNGMGPRKPGPPRGDRRK